MPLRNVSPTYTQAARQEGVGQKDASITEAYFKEVDGRLEVVTDAAEATHSWETYDGRRIIAPYREDSTMLLGRGGLQLGAVRVPASELLLHWEPGSTWSEFPVVAERASEASYLAFVPEEVFVESLHGAGLIATRASEATYLADI